MTKIVCIADTHGFHRQIDIPDADILIHAGDIGIEKWPGALYDFNRWLGELPHPHKVVIPGNHDFWIEKNVQEARQILTNCHFLIDQQVIIKGFKIYGSPWQPYFFDWAWNLQRGEQLRRVWAQIPNDTDILVTHGPPYKILDFTPHGYLHVGCEDLAKRIREIKPMLHICGHIHYSYGIESYGPTTYVNASICSESYAPINLPIVIELEDK